MTTHDSLRHCFLRTLAWKCHLQSVFRLCGGDWQWDLPGQLWNKLGWTQRSRTTWSCLSSEFPTPSTAARPLPAPSFACLHHTAAVCTTPAQGSLTQQCLSLLHPLYALPSCQCTHCARQTNEDHSKCRGILKYNTQSHQNTAVCPDGPTLPHYWLLQGRHALCFRLVCQKDGTVPVIYSTFSQMALTCLYKLWQMSI